MVYAGGHVSVAHYNPAVTMAVLVRRRIGLPEAVGYWAAQIAGGLIAAAVVSAVVPAGKGPSGDAVGARTRGRGSSSRVMSDNA
ncbi:MAG TPA: aquaporin [Mycobacterium sp.]